MNRNHFFLIGLVVLFAGLQFRLIDTYVLTDRSSRFLAERLSSDDEPFLISQSLFARARANSVRVITPPPWIGWALLSIGSVLTLHALVMPKVGG